MVALALGVAFGSAKLFGVSFALGAFFAGVVVNESDLSHRAATDLLPLQDAFARAVLRRGRDAVRPGDPRARSRSRCSRVLAIIVVGKSLAAFAIVLRARATRCAPRSRSPRRWRRSASSRSSSPRWGSGLGVLPPEGQSLIVAGALLSITLNSLLFFCGGALGTAQARFPEAR